MSKSRLDELEFACAELSKLLSVSMNNVQNLEAQKQDLIEKLRTAVEALKFYAEQNHMHCECFDSSVDDTHDHHFTFENGLIANKALREIGEV